MNQNGIIILMADDDDDDFILTRKALEESKLLNSLCRVKDGEELMDYLKCRGNFVSEAGKDLRDCGRPGVILLDLNMPRKDGREALKEIKSDPELKDIPVVVFTTSKAEEDIYRSYQLGVNSFITKPVTFEGLLQVIQTLGKYWFEIVELPAHIRNEPDESNMQSEPDKPTEQNGANGPSRNKSDADSSTSTATAKKSAAAAEITATAPTKRRSV